LHQLNNRFHLTLGNLFSLFGIKILRPYIMKSYDYVLQSPREENLI
jgi:hypothetical protein